MRTLCVEKLAWWWFSEPKHVTKFLILITNICCVIDWINYCIIVSTTEWLLSKTLEGWHIEVPQIGLSGALVWNSVPWTTRFPGLVEERRIFFIFLTKIEVYKVCYYSERIKLVFRINPLNPELNPICYLLALLGAHHFLHVSRIRVKLLTFRLLMSYIYGALILDVSRSHTTTQHSR